jgi:hypothetical protein
MTSMGQMWVARMARLGKRDRLVKEAEANLGRKTFASSFEYSEDTQEDDPCETACWGTTLPDL